MGSERTLSWEVGHSSTAAQSPERWVPATVPGAVQLDWAAAEGWAPYWQHENVKQYAWMEDVFWTYRAVLSDGLAELNAQLWFECGGIDYQFEVRLNDKLLLSQEGMFTPVRLNLSAAGAKAGDQLRVMVFPAPKSFATPVDRDQANRSCKPAVSYGWDFHPRLIPLGIWQEASLVVRPAVFIASAATSYHLSADRSAATVTTVCTLSEPAVGQSLRWKLLSPRGDLVVQTVAAADRASRTLAASVLQPELWWPHDQGEPALYTSVVELLNAQGDVVDQHERRIGFRTVRLVMTEDAWVEPVDFPKSRSVPPIQLEINGRKIFGKGSNWVSPEIFPGLLNESRYREQLILVKSNHMNLLRMWGGAPVQKQSFYDLCDELGIMVWQEFPLACNAYPDDADYLRVLDQESRSILLQLRDHASVVLWCGGNELFNVWSKMTDQSYALRLLNANCFELARDTPFLPTSPVMGMGHGHYTFADEKREAWAYFQESNCTAYTEFGCGGPSPVEVLKKIIPADELFPPRAGGSWSAHQGFGVWLPDSHLYLDLIEKYYGPSESLEEIVAKGQLLQAECFKGLFEEARRQKPTCAMALNWCLNEPWPCAANNSMIAWPNHPKASLAAVGDACRPMLASARVRKYAWREGETFDPELWLLSDAPTPGPAMTIDAWLVHPAGEQHLLTWNVPAAPANVNMQGPRVQVRLPRMGGDRVTLELRVAESPEMNSRYVLAYRAAGESAGGRRNMNL